MESRIAQAIETKHSPIALLWADEKPDEAMRFQEGKWGCVMWLAASAAKGRPAACDAATSRELGIAFGVLVIFLFYSSSLIRILGDRVLSATERLMGMILTTVTVEMFLAAIRTLYR
jgi:hypothetical protein